MGIKTKLVLATGFVGAVAMAAAAFGQTGSGSSPTPGGSNAPKDRRAAVQQRRAAAAARRCGRPAARRAQRMVHLEAKVKTPSGFADITADQGEITAIDKSADRVTIKRLDGQSVTATATDETKVCKDGKVSTFDSLAKGDLARLVQVRSDKFNGLRRIVAITPNSQAAAPPGRPASFSGDALGDEDVAGLLGEAF